MNKTLMVENCDVRQLAELLLFTGDRVAAEYAERWTNHPLLDHLPTIEGGVVEQVGHEIEKGRYRVTEEEGGYTFVVTVFGSVANTRDVTSFPVMFVCEQCATCLRIAHCDGTVEACQWCGGAE